MLLQPGHIERDNMKRKFDGPSPTPPAVYFTNKLSSKDNLKLRWVERITSSHLPSANFIFEVTFSDVEAMKFEIVARNINYSEDSDDFMECFAVSEVMPFFSNVIYPGDILLRVNGQSLLRKSVNGEFIDPQKSSSCLENIITAATTSANATPPSGVTIRFMRTGSTSLNFTPSPAELNLFQVDKHIAAKFNVVKVQPPNLHPAGQKQHPTPSATGASGPLQPSKGQDDSQLWSVQLSFIDQQLPTSISQMVLGGAVTWSHTLLLPHSHAAALAQCTQAGVLAAAPTGAAAGVAGPGAFLGPNGAPVSLADYWVPPTASLYTAAPTNSTSTNGILQSSLHIKEGPQDGGSYPGVDALRAGRTVAAAVKAALAPAAPAAAMEVVEVEVEVPLQGDPSSGPGSEKDLLQGHGSVISVGSGVYQLDATTFTVAGAGAGGAVLGIGGNLGGLTGGLLSAQLLAGSTSATSSSNISGGYIKNAARWAAVLQVTVRRLEDGSGSQGQGEGQGEAEGGDRGHRVMQLSLGRFEKEAEARVACKQAVLEVQETRQFRPKRFAQRLALALVALPATTPAPAGPPQQPARPVPGPGAGGLPPRPGVPGYGGPSASAPFNRMAPGAAGAGAGHYRPGVGGSASTGNMLNAALSSKVVSTGEASCGFSNVAKVVVNIAPSVHASGSSGNMSAMLHRPK